MIVARIFAAAAGLAGASGVGLSAAAAHLGGGSVETAATFLLFHAPAFALLALRPVPRLAAAGGLVLLAGVALFSGDLVLRHFAEVRLFPNAAPAGGMAMMAGWLLLGAGLLAAGRGATPEDRGGGG